MKNKLAIIASLTVVGAGIWYLLFRNQTFSAKVQEEMDPVGPIQKDENSHSHIREILHKAKANSVAPDSSILISQ